MPCFLCPKARLCSPLAMEPGSPFENSSSPFHPCLVGFFESWFLRACSTRSSRILGEWQRVHWNSCSPLPSCLPWNPINSLTPHFKYKLSSKSTFWLNYLTLSPPGISPTRIPLPKIQIQGLVLLLEQCLIFEDLNGNFASSYHIIPEVLQRRGEPWSAAPSWPGVCFSSLLPL